MSALARSRGSHLIEQVPQFLDLRPMPGKFLGRSVQEASHLPSLLFKRVPELLGRARPVAADVHERPELVSPGVPSVLVAQTGDQASNGLRAVGSARVL